MIIVEPNSAQPRCVELHTRCRRCEYCLRQRQYLWHHRAIRETRHAQRTWFGTLTLTPANHHQALARARHKVGQQGQRFEDLPSEKQLALRIGETSRELSLYIKRVRKAAAERAKKRGDPSPRLRYLLVAEVHRSGLPHWHMLFHEQDGWANLTHEILAKQWTLGFERWRLSNPQNLRETVYLCKYLSKSAAARVRASQHYGSEKSLLPQAIEQRKLFVEEIDPLLKLGVRGGILPGSTEFQE